MGDYHADTTIVLGIARFGIEEGCLKDAGGEHDLIVHRVVVGIDGLRCHTPFGAVYRLAPFGELLFVCPHVGVVEILVVAQ